MDGEGCPVLCTPHLQAERSGRGILGPLSSIFDTQASQTWASCLFRCTKHGCEILASLTLTACCPSPCQLVIVQKSISEAAPLAFPRPSLRYRGLARAHLRPRLNPDLCPNDFAKTKMWLGRG